MKANLDISQPKILTVFGNEAKQKGRRENCASEMWFWHFKMSRGSKTTSDLIRLPKTITIKTRCTMSMSWLKCALSRRLLLINIFRLNTLKWVKVVAISEVSSFGRTVFKRSMEVFSCRNHRLNKWVWVFSRFRSVFVTLSF